MGSSRDGTQAREESAPPATAHPAVGKASRAGALPAAPAGAGGGAPLPDALRGRMEGAFGADLSAVRVHEGAQAPLIGARAFAQGSDVHFAPGAYQPGSADGQALIGHEVAHVMQQTVGAPAPQAKQVAPDSSPLEAQADALGDRAVRGEPIAPGEVAAASGGGVMRAVGTGLKRGTRVTITGRADVYQIVRHRPSVMGYEIVPEGSDADEGKFQPYAALDLAPAAAAAAAAAATAAAPVTTAASASASSASASSASASSASASSSSSSSSSSHKSDGDRRSFRDEDRDDDGDGDGDGDDDARAKRAHRGRASSFSDDERELDSRARAERPRRTTAAQSKSLAKPPDAAARFQLFAQSAEFAPAKDQTRFTSPDGAITYKFTSIDPFTINHYVQFVHREIEPKFALFSGLAANFANDFKQVLGSTLFHVGSKTAGFYAIVNDAKTPPEYVKDSEAPDTSKADPELKQAVADAGGIEDFQRQLAAGATLNGLDLAAVRALVDGNPANRTALAGLFRFRGQHEWIPSSMALEVTEAAKTATSDVWIDLQNQLTSETKYVIFDPERFASAFDGKDALQGHSGALYLERAADQRMTPQTTYQPVFHEELRDAFTASGTPVDCLDRLWKVVTKYIWNGAKVPSPTRFHNQYFNASRGAIGSLQDLATQQKTVGMPTILADFKAAAAKVGQPGWKPKK